MKYENILSRLDLFVGMSPDDIAKIINCLGAVSKEYHKEDIVWFAGEENDLVGILLSGQLNLIKEDITGNRNIIGKISPPGIFGEVPVCAEVWVNPLTVQAVSESKIMFIHIGRLLTTCTNACEFHNRLIRNLIKVIAKNSLVLNEKIDYLHQKTIRNKLALYLVNQVALQGNDKIALQYNRDELADFLNVNRSALSRELSKLREEGIIDYHKNTFFIKDVPRLNDLSET